MDRIKRDTLENMEAFFMQKNPGLEIDWASSNISFTAGQVHVVVLFNEIGLVFAGSFPSIWEAEEWMDDHARRYSTYVMRVWLIVYLPVEWRYQIYASQQNQGDQ